MTGSFCSPTNWLPISSCSINSCRRGYFFQTFAFFLETTSKWVMAVKKLAKSAYGMFWSNWSTFFWWCHHLMSALSITSNRESRRSGSNFGERKRDVSSITFADWESMECFIFWHKMIVLSTNGADRMGFFQQVFPVQWMIAVDSWPWRACLWMFQEQESYQSVENVFIL